MRKSSCSETQQKILTQIKEHANFLAINIKHWMSSVNTAGRNLAVPSKTNTEENTNQHVSNSSSTGEPYLLPQ